MAEIEIGDNVDFTVSGTVVEIYKDANGRTHFRVNIDTIEPDEEGCITLPSEFII